MPAQAVDGAISGHQAVQRNHLRPLGLQFERCKRHSGRMAVTHVCGVFHIHLLRQNAKSGLPHRCGGVSCPSMAPRCKSASHVWKRFRKPPPGAVFFACSRATPLLVTGDMTSWAGFEKHNPRYNRSLSASSGLHAGMSSVDSKARLGLFRSGGGHGTAPQCCAKRSLPGGR